MLKLLGLKERRGSMNSCSQHGFLMINSHGTFAGKSHCKFLFMQQEKIPGCCHSDASFKQGLSSLTRI